MNQLQCLSQDFVSNSGPVQSPISNIECSIVEKDNYPSNSNEENLFDEFFYNDRSNGRISIIT